MKTLIVTRHVALIPKIILNPIAPKIFENDGQNYVFFIFVTFIAASGCK